MAKILSKGFKLAESLLEQVDGKVESSLKGDAVGGGEDAVAVQIQEVDGRAAALDAQVQDLHRQLADQRTTIADLRQRLTKSDPGAVEAAALAADELKEEVASLKHLLAQERDGRAAALAQLKAENDVLTAALERERLSLQSLQLSSHRLESRYTAELESLQRQLEQVERGGDQNAGKSSDSLSAALERELQAERRKRQACENELTTMKEAAVAARAAAERSDREIKDLQGKLSSALREAVALRTIIGSEASVQTERRLLDAMARLAAVEAEKDTALSETRSSRHLIAELRFQLQELRTRADDLTSERQARPQRAPEPPRNFADGLLVSMLRLLSKNDKARLSFAVYLICLHLWGVWLVSFHSHATLHGNHPK